MLILLGDPPPKGQFANTGSIAPARRRGDIYTPPSGTMAPRAILSVKVPVSLGIQLTEDVAIH